MILPVVLAPHPLLKSAAQAVSADDPAVQALIDNLIQTMNHHPRCVGLAAPQVGIPWRVIVVDASRVDKEGSRHGVVALVNPMIVAREGQRLRREGCLSVPDYTGNVLRAERVEVEGIDRHGRSQAFSTHGFEAIVFQHEIDHIDGLLFLDRVSSLETDVFRRKKYT